jgi:hypothetical protein
LAFHRQWDWNHQEISTAAGAASMAEKRAPHAFYILMKVEPTLPLLIIFGNIKYRQLSG